MDIQILNDASVDGLVLSTAQRNEPNQIPDTMVKGGIALNSSETAFVEKTLHYISSIDGCILNELTLRTNTKYPSRYIIQISGLPKISLHDFVQICTTNANIREITINIYEATINIDVWRQNKNKKKKKRKRERTVALDLTNMTLDLSNVATQDKSCLKNLVQSFTKMKNVQTQFDCSVDTTEPEMYTVEMKILDNITVRDVVSIQHQCRTFCRAIYFNFPQKKIQASCLHLSAPLKRRVLKLNNR
jgi:hypothetical protein